MPLEVEQRQPVRRVPWALVVVLGLGAVLRLAVIIGDWPTARRNADVYPFVTAARTDLFGDPLHPAGYPIFLRVLHGIWPSPVLPTVLQHVLALVGAYLLYDIARRLGVRAWIATIPAAVVALSIDQVATEHLLMSDTMSSFLLVLSVWLFVRAHTTSRRYVYLVAAGAAIAAAFTVRPTAVVVILLLFVGAWWAAKRPRWIAPASLVIGIALILGPYLVATYAATGRWSITRAGGWSEYTRVAPFADCTKFTPPEGTAFLCESTPPSQRGGPDFYAWQGGPARATYGDFIYGNEELRAFSSAALRAQPLVYASEVLHDLSRFFLPIGARHEPGGGAGPWAQAVDTLDPGTAVTADGALSAYYGDLAPRHRPTVLTPLGELQPYLRIGTYALSAACLVGLVGAAVQRRRRGWIVLFLGIVVGTLFLCVATANYTWRYALPVIPFAYLAGAVGLEGILIRFRDRRRDDVQPAPATDGEQRGNGADVAGEWHDGPPSDHDARKLPVGRGS